MAAGLIHDLASPLTSVLANLELLTDQDKQRQRLRRALLGVQQMQSYLALARQQLTHQPDKPVTFDVSREVTKVTTLLRTTAADHGVTFDLQPEANLSLTVTNSPAALHKVLFNILTNAIEAYDHFATNPTNTKPISISVKNARQAIRIAISDQAGGMTPEQRDNLFQPFFSTKQHQHLGLGLTICHEQVLAMGGDIIVHSILGQGTTFIISLPAGNGCSDSSDPVE